MTAQPKYRVDSAHEQWGLQIDTSAPLRTQIKTAVDLMKMSAYILRAEPGLPAITNVVCSLLGRLMVENGNLQAHVKELKETLLDCQRADTKLMEKATGVLRSETATDETRRRMAASLEDATRELSDAADELRRDIEYQAMWARNR
jgi:hypothetical protein